MTVISANPATLRVGAENRMGRVVPSWVSAWLWGVAALVILMVMVGGATRLTGSGLSITEWRPVSGALPPLSEADWHAEFARYRASPQYHLLNAGMSLADFKSIFWWEWGHRQLGRFIGLVYVVGFAIGLLRRTFPLGDALRLAGMGLLLGFQGLIGWMMVASGLKAGMTAVEPVDLAAHLLFASLFLVTVVAMATRLGRAASARRVEARFVPILPRLIVLMVLVQLVLGALVAGSHAGLIYNSWPDMDGRFVPPLPELFASSPWWANLFENVTLIQLDHRLGAYVLVGLALWNAIAWPRRGSGRASLAPLAWLLALLAVAQMGLGIFTLLSAVPLHAALGHQLLAMFVLVAAVRLAVLTRLAGEGAVSTAASPLAAHVATR
jgi:cytochrome c oxidase assembly protein subunit 15